MLYYKYKGYYRLVILGVCDANYFLCDLISVHMAVCTNDRGILANLEMGIRLRNEVFNLARVTDLVGCDFKPLPFFLLGDEKFP